MARVTIKRSSEWLHKLRNVHVIVDGVDFATLKNGERKVINLPEGKHHIQAKMSWFGSRKLDFKLTNGGYTSFYVKGYKHAKYTSMASVFVAPVYLLLLMPFAGFYLAIGSAIILYLMYMLFVGRHKYLEIENVSPGE